MVVVLKNETIPSKYNELRLNKATTSPKDCNKEAGKYVVYKKGDAIANTSIYCGVLRVIAVIHR